MEFADNLHRNSLSEGAARTREVPPASTMPDIRRPDMPRCLRDFYCEAHGLSRDQFVDHFLPKALHLSARVIYPLARIFLQDIDKGDRELLMDIGTCDSKRAIRRTLGRLPHYYADWNFWRSAANLRISSRKISARIAKYSLL